MKKVIHYKPNPCGIVVSPARLRAKDCYGKDKPLKLTTNKEEVTCCICLSILSSISYLNECQSCFKINPRSHNYCSNCGKKLVVR